MCAERSEHHWISQSAQRMQIIKANVLANSSTESVVQVTLCV